MKILFFKNESHFYSRISYVWENAEKVNVNSNSEFLKSKQYIMLLFSIPVFVFSILFSHQIVKPYWYFIAIIFFSLPLHELCHALFCWISKRKIDRICFFPDKNILTGKVAYVMPALGAWNKNQAAMFFSFPVLILTIFPAILAVFIPSIRILLLFLSSFNISISCFDIIKTFNLLRLPTNAIYFGAFSLITVDNNKPVVIHQLSITPNLDEIKHRQFEYFDGSLIEKDQACETNATKRLKQEFINQFNLEQ